MNTSVPEPWFETLQGRRPSNDRETREAQAMREYFEARLKADLVPQTDPVRERRLRNLVEAQFADNATGSRHQSARTLSPLSAWLQSWNLGWPSLGAATAAVVLGVLIGPLWQSQHPEVDDWSTPKTLPSAPTGPASPARPTEKSFNPNAATTPQEFASQVRLALGPLGIQARVETAPDGMRITAQIPEAQRSAATQALKNLGLEVPNDGRLRVLVR